MLSPCSDSESKLMHLHIVGTVLELLTRFAPERELMRKLRNIYILELEM